MHCPLNSTPSASPCAARKISDCSPAKGNSDDFAIDGQAYAGMVRCRTLMHASSHRRR
jgi:hypothetical protein